MSDPHSSLQPVRVWDLPTRAFHWALAFAVVAAVISGEVGGNALLWHMRLGLLAMGLLLFRLVWGFVGGRWSRFASFFYLPATILRYLRGQHRADEHLDVGHNPLGSLSVWALLGLLALQVASGLVADDEIATVGPLNKFASEALVKLGTSWHTSLGKVLIIVLAIVHVAAVVFYLHRKKINLVQPMLTGDKVLPAATPASADTRATRVKALLVAAVAAALVFWVAKQG